MISPADSSSALRLRIGWWVCHHTLSTTAEGRFPNTFVDWLHFPAPQDLPERVTEESGSYWADGAGTYERAPSSCSAIGMCARAPVASKEKEQSGDVRGFPPLGVTVQPEKRTNVLM